ncbi:hypothetical protein NP590_00760 [Methylomonas sp. SURF-2]|uniref:Uncharacterized protein n=1 Tax=Methylomonas subterranea TaxID=2952225 RepID=A0ABT1TBY5_9GAMM|nr:hypothetical protein [Methylomonas sp. SURF-2]MCQ8102617.1 hypothetical protein [Methylomonas sp. SURF-2]
MNKIKLMTRLEAFFNSDVKEEKKKVEEIKGVIKKLKAKQNKIKKMLEVCPDQDMKNALQLEVNIIQAQIDKGEAVLKNL